VARGCAIFTFYPLLSTGRIGYALGWRQALVMVWAGLRGAVGVAMSLFIFLDPLIKDEAYKVRCLFFMALMAFATVLLNGSTTKYVLQVGRWSCWATGGGNILQLSDQVALTVSA
jgi:NhaP-type Na+/H+ or K+/H+ antiporter